MASGLSIAVPNLSKILFLKFLNFLSIIIHITVSVLSYENMCKRFYSSKQRNYATLSLILSELPKLAIVYHSPLSLQFNVTDKLWTIIGIFTPLNPETRKTPGKKYLLYKQNLRNPIQNNFG